jgi:hypothetical protein
LSIPQTHSRRLGLLGESFDPAGQLLEDLPEDHDTDYVLVSDPQGDADYFDELLVLSQHYALAHLPGLVKLGKPCRILLRRSRTTVEATNWSDGLELLCDAMAVAMTDHITFHALTESSATEFAEITGQPVNILGKLARIETERPSVQIRRDDPLLTFALTEEDGTRNTRQARLDAFSWVRLRRLCKLSAADPTDKDMIDLVAFAEGIKGAPSPFSVDSPPTMIVVVPNGVGLGHVTRMLAIAKAINQKRKFQVIFWCFSRAAAIIQAAGFAVFLRQTGAHLDANPSNWRQWETVEFAIALRQIKPDIVAYDGAAFDQFLLDALRMPGCGRCGVLWVRRGMMRSETSRSVLDPEQYSDLVLEPGDLAVEADLGPTRMLTAKFQGFSKTHIAPPITLRPYLPSHSRREAMKRLRLRRGRYCLVSLGAAFGNWDELLWKIKEHARMNRINLIWAQSPLSPPPEDQSGGAIVRQFYPFSPYLEAFSGVITATGYNSFHELMMGYDRPVLLAPTNLERLDDQEARATHAREQGWAEVLYSKRPEEHGQIIAEFMKRLRKGTMVTTRPSSFADQSKLVAALDSISKTYAR